jgi:hypothetical protein
MDSLMFNEAIKYLNSSVYCRLSPSPLGGIGVFAIRDIPAGQPITDYNGGDLLLYAVTMEDYMGIEPEIRHLIEQQTVFPPWSKNPMFNSPNSNQRLEAFMNHSVTPNSDGIITLREVKKGEEITKDYTEFLKDCHPLNKNILNI